MKKGITITQRFELENVTSVDNLNDAIFTYKENEKEGSADTDYLLIKKMSSEDVTFDDGKFIIPLSQADTLKLTRIYYIEAQLIYTSGATNKWNIARKSLRPTLRTEDVNGQSDGSEVEDLRMTIDDVFANGGGTTSDYNELENKPRFNNIVWQGNKTDSDMGIATKGELQTKADKSDTYTKSETDNLLSGKQNTITGGNGIDVSSDVVSVDIIQGSYLGFENGKLFLYSEPLGHNKSFRQYLVDTAYQNPLASKTYVDNLMSGAVKRLVVETLPTQDIDTNTIYMILKSAPTTNNIYDEYMYINNAWELIGSTEVDLSNYYTKSEVYNKQESNSYYQPMLIVGNGIDITNNEISIGISSLSSNLLRFSNGLWLNTNAIASDIGFQSSMPYDTTIRQRLADTSVQNPLQPKLTAGTNITIDSNNVISASGGGSYTFTNGLTESSGTVGIDLASGSKLLIDANDKLDVDLSSKQDTIDSTHKLSADLVDDTNTTNKFTNATEKSTWNGKADNTTISTDTSSTTVSLTLADNHEYRYTQELTSLTLTMPSGDFIASIVFASGSTPTSMTYDSSIKWSGDDVTSNAFVPVASKTYNIVMWYDGLNINGVVRGVA